MFYNVFDMLTETCIEKQNTKTDVLEVYAYWPERHSGYPRALAQMLTLLFSMMFFVLMQTCAAPVVSERSLVSSSCKALLVASKVEHSEVQIKTIASYHRLP